MNTGLKTIACLAVTYAIGANLSAATIFQNNSPASPLRTQILDGATTAELGDRVTFGGSDRLLTDWSFEYWVTPGSTISGQASLWSVDGSGFPGTLLYQSEVVANLAAEASAEGYGTFINSGFTPFTIAGEVIWTMSFGGIDGTEEYGLLYGGVPSIGSSPDSFYQRADGGLWDIVGSSEFDSFAAQFNAIPEPSTWALLLGGLGMLGFWSYRRKA